MDSKELLCETDLMHWPQLIALSPCGDYIAIVEDKKLILGQVKMDSVDTSKYRIEVINEKDSVNEGIYLSFFFNKDFI